MEDLWTESLDEGFFNVKTIDAQDRKTVTVMTVFSLVLTVIPLLLLLRGFRIRTLLDNGQFWSFYFVTLIGLVAYVVLHELVHGLFYKIFTHRKLTYGFTLTVAFCGVPEIYVRRKVMFVTVLAPFVVFSCLFGSALVLLESCGLWYACAILFSIHLGGCVGDLYVALYMMSHHTDKVMFVNDTGPKQTFYIR